MRRNKFICKVTAAFLSAAMVTSCTPMNNQIRINAAEMEQVQSKFSFGSAGTELAVGEYSLPVSLKNSGDITKDSMAASCVKDGKLIVNQDGTADITINLQAVTVMNITAWAGDWIIYKTDLNGEKETADSTRDEEGNVNSITFRLPNNTMDGVYTDMFVSAMNTTMQAYFAFDFANTIFIKDIENENKAEKKTGTAKVEQFGGYDVNVAVSVLENKITDLEVEGANFAGTYIDVNKLKLQAAFDGLKDSYIGKSAVDAKEIEGIDAVSGATYSSEAIQSAVLNALELESTKEEITLPTEKFAEGTYEVDIAFYTDSVKHSLVENDKAKANITVDNQGNMILTTSVINGTEKEPLYFYDFNGYYEGNNKENELKRVDDKVKKEDIDFTDDVFQANEQVVTEVSFPLEGDFAEIYTTNASIYVPAMKNLTGSMGGVEFDHGRFSSDCFAKIYWDSIQKVETEDNKSGFGSQGIDLQQGVYDLPISMKNATDISKDSMAGSCIQGATLTVKEDGSARLAVSLTSVSFMGQTAWASDWEIYEKNTDSVKSPAEVIEKDEEGHITRIAFTIPDIHQDGVYISVNSGRTNNAYLAFDFANAQKQEEQEKHLEDGVYVVEGTMYKTDLTTKSMADSAFHHNIKMTVEDGKAVLTMNFKGMAVTGIQGYLSNLKYYDQGYQKDASGNPTGELKPVTVESMQKYSDGVVISDDFGKDYPDIVSFELIPEALEDGIVPLQVFVPIMESITAGTGEQNIYLKLDLDNLKKTTAEDELFKDTEKAPENPSSSSQGTENQTPSGGTNTGNQTNDNSSNTGNNSSGTGNNSSSTGNTGINTPASGNQNLTDGVYAVEGTMYKTDLVSKSMADSAFNHTIQMRVTNGKAVLTIDLKGMAITGLQGYLSSMKYYGNGYQKDASGNPIGTLSPVTVQSVQKNSDGTVVSDDFGKDYPDIVSFEVISEAMLDGIVPLQVFVPIMESITAGTGTQNVYLKLDLRNARKTTENDSAFNSTDSPAISSGQNTGNTTGNTNTTGNVSDSIVDTGNPTVNTGTNTVNTPSTEESNTQKPTSGNNNNDNTSASSSTEDKKESKQTVKVGQTKKANGHTYKVTAKGKVAFSICKKNAKVITIPATVKIKNVTHKVVSIARNAMKNNKELTKVVVGKNVSKVGKNAFKGCKKLKTIELSKTLSKKKKAALKKQIESAGISSTVKIK